MASTSKEARVNLALGALQNNKKLSLRAAAKIYNVPRMTLARRRVGKAARRDTAPNSKNLTQSEEDAIVQYIIELVARSFPPRLGGVEDMANQLLRARDAPPVGQLWAHRFVERYPDLRKCWARRYDYQRAKCEDPKVIGEWFALVRNVKAKYGIVDDDIYNFDETGFMMGVIFAGMVVTTSDGRSKAKLAQPGNREWATVIQGVNALGWAIRKANEALSKRRRAKRTRVQLGGSLAVQDAQAVLGQRAVGGEGAQETQLDAGGGGGGRTKVRRCGVCGKPGHNARTCQEAAEAPDLAVSDVIIVGS
jgi:hypothetical protein